MRRALLFLVILAAFFPIDVDAQKKIKVIATIPDLADMARQVAGDLIDATSLATGVEDIHAVPIKPSFVVLLNRANVVVLMGLEAEHAFLPGLLEAAVNPRIRRDAPGYIDCSVYVTPLEVPTRIDRALGDIHPMGNPHFNFDPVLGKAMVRAIADGLSRNYPEDGAIFHRNAAAYTETLDAWIARWQREAAPLKGEDPRQLPSRHDLLR